MANVEVRNNVKLLRPRHILYSMITTKALVAAMSSTLNEPATIVLTTHNNNSCGKREACHNSTK